MVGGIEAGFSLPGYVAGLPTMRATAAWQVCAKIGTASVLFAPVEDLEGALPLARQLMATFRPLPGRTITVERARTVVRCWTGSPGGWQERERERPGR